METDENRFIEIGDRRVGPGYPIYIVAEMSANHNGHFETAVAIVHAAKQAGADAVKIQTYTADTLTIQSGESYFQIEGTPWEGRTLYDLYQEAATPWEWHPKLKQIADEVDIDLFSTPYDSTALEFLEQMQMPVYKISSFENVDLSLLRQVAQTGKPIILSTGMASLAEVEEAIDTIRIAGGKQIALLKCTSAYPAPPKEMNLRAIRFLTRKFGVPVGLSDHTLEVLVVPVGAVAMGASLIEKHLTLSRADGGPDVLFSLEPAEFQEMVQAIRMLEDSLGKENFELAPSEAQSRLLRRSLFLTSDVKKGETFTAQNVRSIRPGYGLHPRHLEQVLGRTAARDVKRGTPITWDMVQDGAPNPRN